MAGKDPFQNDELSSFLSQPGSEAVTDDEQAVDDTAASEDASLDADADAAVPEAAEGAEAADASADAEAGKQAEAGKEDAAPRMVPLQALDEARAELRSLKAQSEADRQTIGRMNQLFEGLIKRMGGDMPQKPQEDQTPDFEEAPADNLNTRMGRIEEVLNTSRQQQQQTEEMHRFWGGIQQLEQTFAGEHKDYYDALNHARTGRFEELTSAGIPAQQAMAQIQQEETQLAAYAIQNNKNPAEMAYQIAKKRGWSGSQQPAPDAQGQGQGQPADPAAAAKLKAIQEGQQRGQTAGSGGGAPGQMTLEDLANIEDDAEFSRRFDEMVSNDRPLNKLFPN